MCASPDDDYFTKLERKKAILSFMENGDWNSVLDFYDKTEKKYMATKSKYCNNLHINYTWSYVKEAESMRPQKMKNMRQCCGTA